MNYNINTVLPYLKDLDKLNRLNTAELLELLAIYHLTKALSARNAIVEYYLPMIPQLLYRYTGQGVPLPDLLQSANLKLIEVIDAVPNIAISNLRGFIIRSVNNHILNMLRANNTYNQLLSNIARQ